MPNFTLNYFLSFKKILAVLKLVQLDVFQKSVKRSGYRGIESNQTISKAHFKKIQFKKLEERTENNFAYGRFLSGSVHFLGHHRCILIGLFDMMVNVAVSKVIDPSR